MPPKPKPPHPECPTGNPHFGEEYLTATGTIPVFYFPKCECGGAIDDCEREGMDYVLVATPGPWRFIMTALAEKHFRDRGARLAKECNAEGEWAKSKESIEAFNEAAAWAVWGEQA